MTKKTNKIHERRYDLRPDPLVNQRISDRNHDGHSDEPREHAVREMLRHGGADGANGVCTCVCMCAYVRMCILYIQLIII